MYSPALFNWLYMYLNVVCSAFFVFISPICILDGLRFVILALHEYVEDRARLSAGTNR